MDFENYWQQNKKSLTALGAGLLVYLIASFMVNRTYGSALSDVNRERRGLRTQLGQARYDSESLKDAREDNETLVAARDALMSAVAFRPRPDFVIDTAGGTVPAQYFTRVEEVRDRLSRRASRAGLRPPDDAWGIEMPETNAAPVIERHMEALDLIDRVANLAIDTGVARISRIQVDLDPGLNSKKGLGRIERTRVRFTFDATSASVSDLLDLSQETGTVEEPMQALAIEEFNIKNERNRPGQVKAEVTFQVVRMAGEGEESR